MKSLPNESPKRMNSTDAIAPTGCDEEALNVARQGYAGLLWSKQFYNYVIREWLNGDPGQPKPPPERHGGRNAEWKHLFNRDIISMPDKWEYPWFAAWDLAFHMVPVLESRSAFRQEAARALSCANGTCTRTASSRPTSSPLAT